jgi:hypothetical protein
VAGNSNSTAQAAFKYDNVTPTIGSVNADRPPDAPGGWYNHPVTVAATATNAQVSGLTCGPVSYSSGDGVGVGGSAGCISGAGLAASGAYKLNYDATPPTMTGAVAERPVDYNGWYNHPVSFTFTGSDATSGLAGCNSARYSGPDDPTARLNGSCRDNAGNVNLSSVGFKYDATKPRQPQVFTTPANHAVAVGWDAPGADSIIISRSIQGASQAPVQVSTSSSATGSYLDKGLANGQRYVYTVTSVDQAGNSRENSARGIPTKSTMRPFAGTVTGTAPALTWKRVKGAAFYNIQIWRSGKKVLSKWPSGTGFRMPAKWSFKNRTRTLQAGYYRWYVWSWVGSRRHGHYKYVGTSSFRFKP